MSNRNSGAGCIVGLLFFMAFGFFFILDVPFSIFPFIGFFPVIFIFIVIIVVAGASSGKSKCCKPGQKKYDQYSQQQVPRVNQDKRNTINIVNNKFQEQTLIL
jgi:hypothetical protein